MNGTLEAGTELGGYRITGMLGRGGMGAVYEAEHKLLKKKAALKTLTPELASGEEFRERFIREAQTVAAIDHPNIIPIYDAADVNGLVYIAMRYVKGPDLEKLIEAAGVLDPHQALAILEQVAGALDAAHAYEIVHRDVKPPNVMIEDGSGRIYLMDFGIAKQGAGRGMTQAGMFVGTPDYAAPEQIQGQDITTAADVYAFGGLLYQCLTGQKPYPRDEPFQVMFAHVTEPPPKVTAVKPELPEALDDVIAKAMAKAPEERHATCRELIDAARVALGETVSTGRTSEMPVVQLAPKPAAARSNLPVPASPLVGRDAELEAVLALVRRDDSRLVTLSGLGGTGKTRLAIEAARTLQPELGAAYFVDLAPVREPQLVGSAIADVLGVREAPDKPIAETIAERFGDEPSLLLLDNFEQVQPAAPLVAEILAAAPKLKVMATSRMLLHLRGEREYQVPTLQVPDGAASAADSPAVRLFVDRAQEAKPAFELTDENLPAVAEICRRLEGIPLAIELAAARVKLMTPQQIVGRLDERLSFLTGGSSGDSLRDAIEWSYNLLDDTAKKLFARIGVFVGGTSLEGAEAVAGQPLGLEFGEVLDDIAQLVDNSLVRQIDGADGEPRFRMLETIREYAIARLEESGDLADARNRHLQRYVELAERAEPELIRSGQAVWLERLTEENDNIRAALAWSFESGQVGLGLRLAGALVRFWSYRGFITEGRRWLTDALQAATGTEPLVLAKAYYAAGFAALGQGDYPQAKPFFEESLVLARQAGDVRQEAAALQQIGWIVMTRGNYEPSHGVRARQLAGKALELAREINDKLIQSGALNILAEVAVEEGDEATANELYARSLTLRREIGDRRLIANSVLTLGRNELVRCDYERATQLLQEGLALAQELRDTWSMSLALVGLGRVALQRGDDPAAAERFFADGLALAKERGDKRVAAECLQGLAAVIGTQGDGVQAARLFGAGEALLESLSATPSTNEVVISERFVPPVKAALGDERFGAEWQAGRATPPDEAIALALAAAANGAGRVAATA